MKAPLPFILATVVAVAGCSTQVCSTGDHAAGLAPSGVLPRPQRILVAGFQLRPDQVELDRGLTSRLQRQVGASDPLRQQVALAQEVEQSTVGALMDALWRQGYRVERTAPGQPPAPGDLLIDGQFVLVDQGNRTRRLAIGFGAGRSDVSATVAVSYFGTDLAPRVLQTYTATSNSGRRSGLAVGGAGAFAQASAVPALISGGLAVSGETNKAGITGEGRRSAEELLIRLGRS